MLHLNVNDLRQKLAEFILPNFNDYNSTPEPELFIAPIFPDMDIIGVWVQYRHFDTSYERYSGVVLETKTDKWGCTWHRIQPDAGQGSLLKKWVRADDVDGYLYYEGQVA